MSEYKLFDYSNFAVHRYYGFTVLEGGQKGVCKEGYNSAAAFLAHLENVGSPLGKALKVPPGNAPIRETLVDF